MMATLANFHSSANKLLENFLRRPQIFSQGQICLSLGVNWSHMVKGGENVLGLNWRYLTWWEGKLEHKRRDRCRIGSRAEFRAPELGRECRGSVTRGWRKQIAYKSLTSSTFVRDYFLHLCSWRHQHFLERYYIKIKKNKSRCCCILFGNQGSRSL